MNFGDIVPKNATVIKKKRVSYRYDALNRITRATGANNHYDLNSVSYDKNGNILSLSRNGHLNIGATSFGLMDNLTYTYDSGNKLTKVQDIGNTTYGFKDGANTTTEYTYDANGNMTSDLNKGIASIEYNHLNMPTKITVTGANAGVLDYKYSADGIKLQKKKTQGGFITTTDYAGDYIYENNTLKQFYHPEGYVENNSGNFKYVYQLKDIWGNTRITYADTDNNGIVAQSEIRREQNYYIFGLEHRGYNDAISGVKNNLKTYQGQEFTEDLGLNTHEWKYRMSDPAIGRFWQVDPLAEDYVYNSTYAFQENKMGMGVELEGLELSGWNPMNGIGGGITQSVNNKIGAGPKDSRKIENINNVINGSGNVIMGTVGAIGSAAYSLGTLGAGAAAGGGAALMLSIAEISIGFSQISDAVTNDSGNTNLQESSSLPGLIAKTNNVENSEMIDAVGQFVPGLLTGGNIAGVIKGAKNILKGNTSIIDALSTIDAAQDTKGVYDAAQNFKMKNESLLEQKKDNVDLKVKELKIKD